MWSKGDYPRVAERLVPIAEDLVDAVQPVKGLRLLDVAAGTGNVALAAARRGAVVTATDITARMIELGQARMAKAGFDIPWYPADAVALPFEDGGFDVAVSCLGVMFVSDSPAAVGELARVLRPGGRLGLASWCPDRDSEVLFEIVRRRTVAPPGKADPAEWGRKETLEPLLRREFSDIHSVRRPFDWRFASAAAAVDYFASVSPMHVSRLAAIPAADRGEVLREMEVALADFTLDDGSVLLSSGYLLTTCRR